MNNKEDGYTYSTITSGGQTVNISIDNRYDQFTTRRETMATTSMDDKIVRLEKELEQLKKARKEELEKAKETGLMRLERGELRYIIHGDGYVQKLPLTVILPGIPHRFGELGNAFKSKEEAEKEVTNRKIHQRLKELASGYEYTTGRDNLYIDRYYTSTNRFRPHCIAVSTRDARAPKRRATVYFKYAEEAIRAIDIIKDEFGRDAFMNYLGS